jgi:hypothetical protein
MKSSRWSALLVLVALMFSPATGGAQSHGHGHGSGGGGMKMDSREVLVEGVKVTFQIMTNAEHKKMLVAMKSKEEPEKDTSHNLTVVLTDAGSGKEIPEAQAKMKVIDPAGREQVKSLRYSPEMKSYDNYFSLADKGRYQLIIAFKSDEKVRNAGIYYEVK